MRTAAALLIPATIALAASRAATAETSWQSLYGRSVLVLFREPNRQEALLAAQAADELAAKLEVGLGFRLDRRARVVVCPSHEEFERQAGGTQGVWVLGLAMPSGDRVLVKALPASTLRNVTRHELAHLFVGKALGDYSAEAPRWLHEGTAKYYSQDWSAEEKSILSEAQRDGKLYRVSQLSDFPTNPEQTSVAYAESYVLVRYLLSLDPQHSLAGFIANLKETRDVERAFRRAYGLSEAQVEAGLRQAISRETRGVVPMWAVDTAIFFLMALLFLIGYRRVRRRSREIRERLEQEELLERLFDQSRRRRRLWGPRP